MRSFGNSCFIMSQKKCTFALRAIRSSQKEPYLLPKELINYRYAHIKRNQRLVQEVF